MKKLTLSHTPIPFSDEFLGSFILRTSYINGYQSPKQMLNSSGIHIYQKSYESIFTNEDKFNQVIEYLNLSKVLLDLVINKVPPTFQNFYWTRTHIIQSQLIEIDLNKFCPVCLKENGYWKKNWLLKPLTVCTDHLIELVTNCPNCQNSLQISRRSLFECSKCYFDLRSTQKQNSTSLDIGINNWFIDNLTKPKGNFIEDFFDIWIALLEYFEILNTKINLSYILKLCHDFFYDKDLFISVFIDEISNNLKFAHPRIQLLPFLKNINKFKYILSKILSTFTDYRKNSPQIIDKKFNKNDARHVLGVSFASFHKRLKAGILYHDELANNEKNIFSSKILEDWLISEKNIINGVYTYNHPPQLADESNHYYTIPQIMEILDINNANTRLLLNIPDIPTTKKYLNRYTQLCLEKNFVDDFNKKYIFLSTLAKRLDVPTLTLRHKLLSLNIEPIYTNKAYVPYYNRNNISHLTKSIIENIKNFKHNIGRKSKRTKPKKNGSLVTLNKAANLLDISASQVTQLIKHGWLKVNNPEERPHRIILKSIDNLIQQKNDPSYIDIDVVLEAFNCTFQQLQKNWMMTKFLTIRHVGYWRSFPKVEFEYLIKIREDYFTASEGNAYLGMHRTHLTNLVSKGIIQPHKFGNHNYSINLFKRDDVKRLKDVGGRNNELENKSKLM